MIDTEYDIYLGEEKIGTAKDVEIEFPNIVGRFEPSESFAHVAHLFEREYGLIKGDPIGWDHAREEIFKLGLKLVGKSDGTEIKAVLGPTFGGNIGYLH